MIRLLHRLSRLSTAELLFRTREAALTGSEALRYGSGAARWRRDSLRQRVRPLTAELAHARAALRDGGWREAGTAFRSHFARRAPRFVLDPSGRQARASLISQRFPNATADAIRRADELVEGRHRLLGYTGLTFGGAGDRTDWQMDPVHDRQMPKRFWARVPYLAGEYGDHKVIWELNRHQHWLALGRAAWLSEDLRYTHLFQAELLGWLRANPPLSGVNWASMLELGFRSISWIWALHFFAAMPEDDKHGSAWIVDLLVGLERQLNHVAGHLSYYFSPNTHLLGEGLALYVGGRVLPELTAAARWQELGRNILLSQGSAQVNPDGGHAELSAHYHRYALDFYLLALAIARRTGDPAASHFADTTARLAGFCRVLADQEGHLPTIGDDDGGLLFPICGRAPADAADSLALAAALLDRPDLAVSEPPEEVFWMVGETARAWTPSASDGPPSQVFPDTGYVVLRSATTRAILDAGPHGFLNGGHAHADALSVVLSIGGRPLLIDAGTATYTMDAALRDRFRSTAMHNTVVLDGRSQSLPAGPFHWRTQARGRVVFWRPAADFDYVEAEHDGYLPVIHRRAMLRLDGALWVVADFVLGTGPHRVDAYWHVAPEWALEDAGSSISLSHRDGLHVAVSSSASDRQRFIRDPGGLGWAAPVYGQVVPAPTVRFSMGGNRDLALITAIQLADSTDELPLKLLSVAAPGDGWARVAAVLGTAPTQTLVLFATPQTPGHLGTRSLQRVAIPDGELLTDARCALLRFVDGHPSTVHLIDVTRAHWTGPGSFDAGPLSSAADLHSGSAEVAGLRTEPSPRVRQGN